MSRARTNRLRNDPSQSENQIFGPEWEFPSERPTRCDSWCKPLHFVEIAVQGEPWAKYFDVNDFMIMSRCTGRPATITHYKHRDTRKYINVDSAGRPESWYRPLPNYGSLKDHLQHAVEALGLWELPWFRDELSEDRLGLEWNERFLHPLAPNWWNGN